MWEGSTLRSVKGTEQDLEVVAKYFLPEAAGFCLRKRLSLMALPPLAPLFYGKSPLMEAVYVTAAAKGSSEGDRNGSWSQAVRWEDGSFVR